MGLIPITSYTITLGIFLVTSTGCFGIIPTDMSVSCPNYNCTLLWDVPENTTSEYDVIYTAQYKIWAGANGTFFEIPNCVNIRRTECNLLPIVTVDSLSNIHFVQVSAIVNGERSTPEEASFIPNKIVTLEHPEVVLIKPIQATSFTVHVHAPMSPYEDPNTGELYRVNELPPFSRFIYKARFRHTSTLFLVKPNNELEDIQDENGPTIDKELTFNNLAPDTTYRFEVYSGLSFGRLPVKLSKEPAIIMVTTLKAVPSEGPTLLSIVRRPPNCTTPDESLVVVSWKAPPREHWNGRLTHYFIRYIFAGRNFSQAAGKNCSAADTILVLPLLRWQAYEFAVSACNSIGCTESKHRTLFNQQAIVKGSKPRNISIYFTATQPLVISWEPPPPSFMECVSGYMVTVNPVNKKPTIKEVISGTVLRINDALPEGSYVVVVSSYIRSGINSSTPGETVRKDIMIDDKTTHHLVLPLVIVCSFVFCAVIVAIVICAKCILRPLDVHLEKTRALRVAREYHVKYTHYRQTEREIYDPLPSSRPSLSGGLSTTLLWSESSAVDNRLAEHHNGDALPRPHSFSEDPLEDDVFLESVLYSPVLTRNCNEEVQQLLDKPHNSEIDNAIRDSLGSKESSTTSRIPMLTIEVPADPSSPRVVRWKARGVDSFDYLPIAEDFDESDIQTCSTESASPSTVRSERLRERLNYPSLVLQTSESSESDDTQSENELNYDSQSTRYAQLASNIEPSNSVPIASFSEDGYAAPYSQMANSQVREPELSPIEGRDNRTRSNTSEEYAQLACTVLRTSPAVREMITGDTSDSCMLLDDSASPRSEVTSNDHRRRNICEHNESTSYARPDNHSTSIGKSPTPNRTDNHNNSASDLGTDNPYSSHSNNQKPRKGCINSDPHRQHASAFSGLRLSHSPIRKGHSSGGSEPYVQLLPSGSVSPSMSSCQATNRNHRRDIARPSHKSVRLPVLHSKRSQLLPSHDLDVRGSDYNSSDTDNEDSFSNNNHESVDNVEECQFPNMTNGASDNHTEQASRREVIPNRTNGTPDNLTEQVSQSQREAADSRQKSKCQREPATLVENGIHGTSCEFLNGISAEDVVDTLGDKEVSVALVNGNCASPS